MKMIVKMNTINMKKGLNYYTFVLLCVLVMKYGICLNLNFEATQILSSKQQFRIQLQPQKGQPPYTLSYSRLPKNWINTERYLLAQKQKSRLYKQYLISVVLQDSKNNIYRISLVFIVNSQRMLMESTAYPYNINIPMIYLDQSQLLSQNYKSKLQIQIQSIIKQHKSKANGIKQDFNKIFNNILIPQQIYYAASTQNIPVLIKSIAMISIAEINCVQQVAYLSQLSAIFYQVLYDKQKMQKDNHQKFINRMQSFNQTQNKFKNNLRTNNITSNEVNNISVTINDTTPLLQQQRNQRIKQLQKSVKINKSQYMKKLQLIKQAYTQLFTITKILQKGQQILIQINGNTDKTQRQAVFKRKQIQILNIKIPTTLNQQQKNAYKQQVMLMSNQLRQLDYEIDKNRMKAQQQQATIKNINKQVDKRTLIIKNLQTQINTLQISISSTNKQLLFLYKPIIQSDSTLLILILQQSYNLNLRINNQINVLVQQWLGMLSLIDIIDYLDKFLDTIYYECYGVNKIQFSSDVNLYVYQIKYADFIQYMYKAYQKDNKGSKYIMNDAGSLAKVSLNRINVLSTIWSDKFGQALTTSLEIQSDNKIKLPICNNIGNIIGYNGIILQIINNIIQIRVTASQGNIIYVFLGICTRIEMSSKLPTPGSMIFWRGVEISRQVYDGYYVLIV